MMIRRLFSIVIPIYKAEKYLDECVRSVLNQDYEDFELILVDDGSPDRCPEICDYYSKIDDRVKVIHKKNEGSVNARKTGVERACGEYIVFLDSDDWMERELLSDLNKILEEYHPTTVVYGYKLFSNNHLSVYYQNTEVGFYNGDKKEQLYETMISKRPFFSFGIYPTLWTTCTKRKIVLDVQKEVPCEITLGDDASVVYASLLNSDSIYVSNITGCVYRDNNQSMTHTFDRKMDKRVTVLSNYITDCMQKYKLNNMSQVDDYLIFMAVQVVGNYLLNRDIECTREEAREKVNSFLSQPIIRDALVAFDNSKLSCPISTRVKVALLKKKSLGLYTFLARTLMLINRRRI